VCAVTKDAKGSSEQLCQWGDHVLCEENLDAIEGLLGVVGCISSLDAAWMTHVAGTHGTTGL
jgi:hypothetical protein